MTTKDSIIIFHRSKHNTEDSISNQLTFLESYRKHFIPSKVIDYQTGDYRQAKKISELVKEQSAKIMVIINSNVSRDEYDKQYDMYYFFHCFKIIGTVQLYLMDSEGRLYKEVKNIDEVLVNKTNELLT